jgi:hypothetical protein
MSGSVEGQTVLNEGELAVIGMDTPGEDFSFVCFVNLDAGTEIYFTDEEADGDYTIGTGEGTVLYSAPAGGLTAGVVVSYNGNSSNFTTTSDGAMALGNSGDGILAYQGSSVGNVTTFLHAIGEDAGDIGTFPGGFTNYLIFGADDGEYDGTRTGSAADLMTAINNSSNWTTSGSGVIPFNTSSFTILGGSTPTITLSESSLTGFTYEEGSGPSAEQSFTVEGSNLTADITLSPTTNYEISESSGSGFGSSITLTESGGSVSSTTIYVRLEAGLSTGTYNDENITAASSGAASQTVECDGSVTAVGGGGACASDLIISEYVEGSGSEKYIEIYNGTGSSVDLSDYKLQLYANGAVTPINDVELSGSLPDGSVIVYQNSSASLYSGTNNSAVNFNGDDAVALYKISTTSFVDIIGKIGEDPGSAWTSGSYSTSDKTLVRNPEVVAGITSNPASGFPTLATEWTLYNEDVISNLGSHTMTCGPTITVTPTILTDFTYSEGSGPSSEQSFTISGTNLTDDIDITPSTNYELSLSDSPWSTETSISLSPTTGTVASTPIYVRLKAGLTDGEFNSEDITASSTGADDQTVTCNGYVCGTPSSEAASLVFSNIAIDQMDVSWTNGDGDYRLVVASTSAITGTPSDNTTYSADANFGDGNTLNAGEFVVYAGNGSSVTMTGLNSDTEYFIKVFEYNCDGGNEQYLTTSPLSGSETTVANIPAVTDFDVTCMTETTATVEWTNPSSGDWDGVAIAVRRGTNPPQVLSGFAVPSALTVNTAFGNAGSQYGTGDDYSYAIYKGTGTSLTVTGLTQGEDYVFKAFSYYNDGYDNSGAITTTSITGLDINEVSSASAAAGNAEALIGWTNPGCYDEILVVGKDGGSVTSNPSGDGSAYSADAAFSIGSDIGTNEYVVYQGTGTSINVTSLTNGNTYYFTIFTRIGTEWSNGVEVFVTPADVTVLEGGDLAIISVNTQYLGTGSDDEWCFISFEDITEGTSIEFTDNGYEREQEGLWGDTEGTVRLTRTSGGTIAAGTPICIQGAGNDNADFTIKLCGADDDANWDVSSLNGVYSFDFNSSDQIWVFQNGNWDNPAGDHDADYTGNVVWGWTGTNWESAYNYASTSGSTLPTGAECFNTDLDGVSTSGKVAYTGDMTQVSQIEWILRINNPANWTDYADNTDFYANSPDYANVCQNFLIGSGGFTDGKWTGQRNTEWFNCGNWESLVIPDETTDVLFDNDDCSNDIELLAGETAECNDLTLQGTGAFSLWGEADPTKTIEIFGDLTIKNVDLLVFDDTDAGTDDGSIILHGNWNNEAGADGFYEGNSTVQFVGSSAQNLINSAGTESFYNLTMNATSDLSLNSTDVTVDNVLTLTSGVLITGASLLHVDNTDGNAIMGYTAASYINGNLRRAITGAGSYDFPVGDASNFEVATVDVASATGLTYLDAHFASADLGDINIGGLGLQVDGTPLVSVLDAGYWQIEPNTGASVNYDIEVNLAGASNAAADAEQHAVIKRDDAASDWELQGNHDNATQSIAAGVVTAKVSGLSAFSQFAIARSNQWVLAVELIDFSVKCETAGLSVNWTTASEDNADYFMIEYSSDTKNWETVQKLPAFGTTHITQEYQVLLEDSPRKGYYRLAEVDMDGTITHYAPDYINCLDVDEQAMITVSPNPATDFAQLSAVKTTSNLYLVAIYDAAGKLVNMLTWENPAEQALKLDLYGFAPGYYQLKIYNEREFYNKKLLVK